MGIKTMQKRQEERDNVLSASTRELWLRDNDQAFVTILTDEKEDENGNLSDKYFSYYFVRRENIATDTGKIFVKKYFLGETREEVPQEYFDQKVVNEQLGFWCYVYYILHDKRDKKVRGNEEWKEEKSAANVLRFREEVNDYKLYLGGLGQKRSFEGEINGIYNEVGALDSMVCRLSKSRTGTNATDVVYNVRETTKKSNIPKEKKEEMLSLPSVLDYVKEHLVANKVAVKKVSNEVVESDEERDDESLF